MFQQSNISSHTSHQEAAPVNSQDQVLCDHGELAPLRTSHTDLNPDRKFYSCRRTRGDPERCHFFVWADELAGARESSQTAVNTPATTPQRSSQEQRAQIARSPDTPISPQKRRRSPSPLPSFPLSDLADKRIKTDHIQDDEDFDHALAIEQNEVWGSQSSESYNAVGSPSSIPFTLPATRLGVDDDVDFGSGAAGPMHLREPGGVSRSLPARLPPQTPSSRRVGFSRAYASGGNVGEVDGGGCSMSTLPTPPGSLHREGDHQRIEDGASSSTGMRGRDSGIHSLLRERQSQGRGLNSSPSSSPPKTSGRERSRWQMIQDDPENPFHERVAALRASSQNQTSPGADVASGSTDGLPGPLSADLVEEHFASLAGLPEYIRKLERRERAAQKSAEVKAKRIVRLEEEIQRLEATVAAFKLGAQR